MTCIFFESSANKTNLKQKKRSTDTQIFEHKIKA